ncbi:MAG: tetratricopeptide repeat protein [Aquificaceae bacterium]|nr:tetratricopeptide repeat protein [Aquificaceae bacterium]
MREVVLRVLGLVFLLLLPVGLFLAWDSYRKKELQEIAYKEYEVSKLIRAGNYSMARELIGTAVKKDSPFKPLLLSYELYMAEHGKEKVEEEKVLKELIEQLKSRELLSLYRERYAYHLFKQGKVREALKELEAIKEEDFNYASALLLRSQILAKEGREKEAKELLKKVRDKDPNSYFANLSQALELAK